MIKIINGIKNYNLANINEVFKIIKKEDINENYKIIANKKDKEEIKALIEFYLYYKEIKRLCEKEIVKYNNSLKCNEHILIKEAVDELSKINCNGKFIRAFLIALGYHNVSKAKDNKYLPLAIAYETFQTSILIHDDIIDKSLIRRGKDTLPVYYINKYKTIEEKTRNHLANSLALCLGDLGFFYTNKIILDNYSNNKNFNKILTTLNDIVIKTIKGEILDVELPFNNRYKNHLNNIEKSVMEIYHLKTSWYTIIGPFLLGESILGKESIELIPIFKKIGIAFQIKDDLLGIYADTDILGKTNTSDISEFKQTILYSYIFDKKKEYLPELLKIYGKENVTLEELEKARNIFEISGSKNYAINKMNELFEQSKKDLNNIKSLKVKYKEILIGFITYLELREK